VGQPQATLIQAGTLLLRDVGRLSLTFQVRLADALGELRAHSTHRRVRRRVMASTSGSLLDRVNDGTFDARLFYRLNVIHLVLPEDDRSGSSRD
jgi:DNA-binding NtrC family response regulator